MEIIGQPYTVGIWTVKPDSGEAFTREWNSFAEWCLRNVSGTLPPSLLQDSNNPQRFISFGAWSNSDAIAAWRALPQFKEFVERVKPLLTGFEPITMKLVALPHK